MNEVNLQAEVFSAINKAAKAMPSLKKGDRNTHGGYNFVSIDDYYEKCARVAHDNGLSWTIRETGSDIESVGNKVQGGVTIPTLALKVSYEFDLMHENGVVIHGFFSASVLHPLQGAQTAGSAMSYASKLFMRNVFTVVTGEGDADDSKGGEDAFDMGGPPPAPQPTRSRTPPISEGVFGKSTGQVGQAAPVEAPPGVTIDNIFDLAKHFIPDCKTIRELNSFWVTNEAEFKRLEQEKPEAYQELVTAFSDRKKVIKGEARS